MQSLYKFLTEQYIIESRDMKEAEKMELLVCYAHNSAFMKGNIERNMFFSNSGHSVPKDWKKYVLDKFNNDPEKYIQMVKPLSKIMSGFKKLQDGASPITNEFLKYAQYNYIPTRMPGKTDIISNDGKYRISVKKNGGAQLCSGSVHDTRGIMLSCADVLSDEDRAKLEALLNPILWYENSDMKNTITDIKKNKNHQFYNDIINAENINKELELAFFDIFARNPKFRKAVIREACTGEHKYGPGAEACANYFYTWDESNPEKSKLETADEFLTRFYNHFNIEVGDGISDPEKDEFRVCFYSTYDENKKVQSARTVFRIDYK